MIGELFGDTEEVVGYNAGLGLEGRPGGVSVEFTLAYGWELTMAGEDRFGLDLILESPMSA